MSLGPGSRLDAYEIVSPLGAGGMGEVWLARDTSLGRKVALKLLPPELTRDTRRVARFQQEARAASALSHPNVCHIYALGQTSDGQHYIAMELVEGQTLRSRLHAERRQHQGRHPHRRADGRRPRCRACCGSRASRREARERHAPARRLREGARLRPRQAGSDGA